MKSSRDPEPEDGGWETVKAKTRSKFSPGAWKITSHESLNHSSITKPSASNGRAPLRATKSTSALPKNDLSNRNRRKSSNSSNSSSTLLEKVIETEAKTTQENSSESTDENDDSEIVKKDQAIALAEKEEENLAREIRKTESEMPPDDLESSSEDASKLLTPSKANKMFEGLSWADQIDLEEQLLESRYPGRAIQLHEKLSSPARKKEPQEAFKAHQEKQKNAKLRRLRFQVSLNLDIREVLFGIFNMLKMKNLL